MSNAVFLLTSDDQEFSVRMKTKTFEIFCTTLQNSVGKEVARSTVLLLAPSFFLYSMSDSILTIYGQDPLFVFPRYKFTTTFITLMGHSLTMESL